MRWSSHTPFICSIKFNMLSSSTPKILIERSLVTPEPFKVKSKLYLQGTIGRTCVLALFINKQFVVSICLATGGSHKLVSAAVRCVWPSWRDCGELDSFETLFLIRFGKKTVGTDLRHRLQLLWSLIFAQTLSYRKQNFEIWSGNEQRPFKFETTKKVESLGLVR